MRLAVVFLSIAAFAASPVDPVRWSAQSLNQIRQDLGSKLNEKKLAGQVLGQFQGHQIVMLRRDGSGDAEQHTKDVDIFFVVSGQATVQVGGKMINPRHTSENELLGSSIEGGTRTRLSAGDIFHIASNVPHRVLVEPGGTVGYVIAKITEK